MLKWNLVFKILLMHRCHLTCNQTQSEISQWVVVLTEITEMYCVYHLSNGSLCYSMVLGVWDKTDDCADSCDCVKPGLNIYNTMENPVIFAFSVLEWLKAGLIDSSQNLYSIWRTTNKHSYTPDRSLCQIHIINLKLFLSCQLGLFPFNTLRSQRNKIC